MITAANDAAQIDEALKLGIVDYLIKPFEYKRFCEAIENFMAKVDILTTGNRLDQNDIDKLVNLTSLPGHDGREYRKGIQPQTLDNIYNCMINNPSQEYTCESLVEKVNLSKITVRRYLNYLVEIGKLSSTIDYSTGGRPSLIYHLK